MAVPDVSIRPSLTSDPTLAPFLANDFSPIVYLNSTLPSWTPSATSLTDLSTQSQTLIAQLDAKLARLSNTLTQLTDDILRSGGRLAYEVEILRADAASLGDVLSTGLKEEMSQLVDGISHLAASNPESQSVEGHLSSPTLTRSQSNILIPQKQRPGYMTTLHMLSTVRSRLDAVIKTFDAAISWPLPPTSLPLKSQFVSVAAPNVMSAFNANSPDDLEAKGRAWEERVREEIVDFLEEGEEGIAGGRERVAGLRGLCGVWKGTVEEKARMKFVEGLERLVEERAREV